MLQRHFLVTLPKPMKRELLKIEQAYEDEDWFEEFWNEYRNHAITRVVEDIRMPQFILNKYIR